MISRIGVGADTGGNGGLHGFEVGITGEATGVGHQVAEGDLVNVGTFGPVGGQVVDDLGIVRDVLLVQELGHGHGGDEFADAGHVHQPVWIPALTSVLGRLRPLPFEGFNCLAVLAEPHGIACDLVLQRGMQGLGEGVNVEMVCHARPRSSRAPRPRTGGRRIRRARSARAPGRS